MKSCEAPGCEFPSWGKDKITGIRYCRNHQYLRTDLDRRSLMEKHMAKQKDKSSKSKMISKIRGLSNLPANKKMVENTQVRSQLLLLADKLFGNFIKKRDAKELSEKITSGKIIPEEIGLTEDLLAGNEFIICPCCNKPFCVNEINSEGQKIVQPLHFVVRDIYSQRFNESQVFAGCGYCNLKMHLNPTGIEYLNYRAFLVERLGNEAVTEIEDAKYKINRFPNSEIQSIIDKYKQKLNHAN